MSHSSSLRVALTLVAASASLLAQSFDICGNPTGSAGPGVDTPGATVSSFTGVNPRSSDLDTWGGLLIATSAYAPLSGIRAYDPFTGNLVQAIPTSSTAEFGLAFDSLRARFVTTNVSLSLINQFDGVNPTPIASLPAPGPGATGIGYDSLRDLYWICLWQSNSIVAVSPSTNGVVSTYSTASFGCTRPAGVAYDVGNDLVLVGGRDQVATFAFHPATGALAWSVPAAGGSSSPQGVAIFQNDATVWTSAFSTAGIFQVEGVAMPTLVFDVSTPGALTIVMTQVGAASDRRLFADVIPGPYTASGPFGGASVSFSQVLLTLSWPAGVGPFSNFGPAATVTYGPFALPPGLTLNGVTVDFVGGIPMPPFVAAGGTIF